MGIVGKDFSKQIVFKFFLRMFNYPLPQPRLA